ncbi:MAG: 4-hydroxybenzoate octaprenyltransferase [Alphaproteobacteria bacterium]|nr:4-hydroxybenzoate octaprenyltransferase [Alphaproteobacteria bacterium]
MHAAVSEQAGAPPGGPIERRAPRALKPYVALIRLDRPIGTWLLLWPGFWALALAATAWPDVRLLVLFGIGALVMRSAGCIYNDIVDRKFDAQVARTRHRPLASGALRVRHAVAFMAVLLGAGLAILLQLHWLAIVLGVASLALIFTYPLMKRITYWPQAFLGLTFNWGALLGWAAATGTLDWPAGLLYLGGIFWTLGYDTIYAHQDKEDDALIGVKSSALALGERTRAFLIAVYALSLVCFALSGALASAAWPFYVGLGAVTLMFGWQALAVRIDQPADCLAKFKSNLWVGVALFAGIVAARVI